MPIEQADEAAVDFTASIDNDAAGKDTAEKPTTPTSEESAAPDTASFTPNTDVVSPSIAEEAVTANQQSAGPDAVPASEASTPPMQMGEDPGSVDETSATVD
jgi:hypothetical protein